MEADFLCVCKTNLMSIIKHILYSISFSVAMLTCLWSFILQKETCLTLWTRLHSNINRTKVRAWFFSLPCLKQIWLSNVYQIFVNQSQCEWIFSAWYCLVMLPGFHFAQGTHIYFGIIDNILLSFLPLYYWKLCNCCVLTFGESQVIDRFSSAVQCNA